MKKNLLTLAALAAFFSAQSQLTYVGKDALVHVSDQALVYSGGGLKVDGTGQTSTTKVDVFGDVMVVSTTDKFEVTGGGEFNLKVDPTNYSTVYGQLYLEGLTQGNITGIVNKEHRADVNHGTATGGRQQTALPFFGYTIQDLRRELSTDGTAANTYINTTSNTLNTPGIGRFAPNSVYKWNNVRVRFDQVYNASATSTAAVGNPTDYYALPRRNASGAVAWDAAAVVKTFKGVPASDEATGPANSKVTLTGAYLGSFGTNGSALNIYSEKYSSYIDDPFRTKSPSWEIDYGKNLYQYGNPFLTNIDLAFVAADDNNSDGNYLNNIEGIAYYGAGSIANNDGVTGSTYTLSNTKVAKVVDGYFQAGDVKTRDLLIKPMQEFLVKLKNVTSTVNPVAGVDGTYGTANTINFNKTRRFAQTSRAESATPPNYSVTASRGMSTISADQIVKQVAVVLLNNNGDEINRTYYAVSPSASTGLNDNNNSLQAYANNTPIYTREELTTGGVDTSTSGLLYVNGANELDFQGKEIPLFVDVNAGNKVKFELYEAGVEVPNGQNLSNGKSFYIKQNDVFTKINSGDVYNLNNTNLGLFYQLPEGTLGTNELLKGKTIVAKKDSDYVVRFSKNWKSATIEIYSAAGQLIHAKKNVNTSSDYILPLSGNVNTMYLVKVTSENGETVTKKIVK